MSQHDDVSDSDQTPGQTAARRGSSWSRERLAELERRSLLAEQARQLAHSLRSPLSVIGLIGETLLVELGENDETRSRLDQVLGSVSRLSSLLSDTVNGTRFADGPQRPMDAAAMAADLVALHGGRAELNGARRLVLVEPDGFAAAILHALHLVCGAGAERDAAAGEPCPRLRTMAASGTLTLELSCDGAKTGQLPWLEGPDRVLMVKAAERVARDHGGSLTLEPGRAVFRLPAAGASEPGKGR